MPVGGLTQQILSSPRYWPDIARAAWHNREHIPTIVNAYLDGRLRSEDPVDDTRIRSAQKRARSSRNRLKRKLRPVQGPKNSKRIKTAFDALKPSVKALFENKEKKTDATMPKLSLRSRKRARKASMRGKIRALRKRKRTSRLRRRRLGKSSKVAGAAKLRSAKRGDRYVATLPRMPRTHTFKFPLYATYEFTIAPKDRLSYMTPTYDYVDAVTPANNDTMYNQWCQAAIGFVVNLNTPHRPFEIMTNTVNMPKPNIVSDGWVFTQNQPIGMRDLLLWMNVNSGLRAEHIVCYSTDVSYTLERPTQELFELGVHGRNGHMAPGIYEADSEHTGSTYYKLNHQGNTNKYIHASWISRADQDFTNLDELHTSLAANSRHRIDKRALQTFKRNLLGDKRLQGELSFMNVPASKSTWAKGSKKWSLTDYPLHAPHPLDKRSAYARAVWDQDKGTELTNVYKDYSYNPSMANATPPAITDLGTIHGGSVVRMPVLVQPFNAPDEMKAHKETWDGVNLVISEKNINNATGPTVIKERTDTLFDLPFIRVKLKLKYHMAIMPGLSPDGVPINTNPQSFDEPTFIPSSSVNP